ncbi:hypothetical protein [Aminipila sp.]|uniref:hypothetical protein n=1 Tax=Aminipila sp. TaxID=2060095 RepID=UPI00289B2F2F|nr:hypothetical protein [Aminipila sp.]
MIVFENKGFQTRSDKPNEDWTGEAKFIAEDGTELANKILSLYPYYNFVLDKEGKLIDVVAIEKPPTPAPTEEEVREKYESLSKEYIHDKVSGYSHDDETKIIREYLANMDNATYKTAFEGYNVYVEECKQRAHKEVYG